MLFAQHSRPLYFGQGDQSFQPPDIIPPGPGTCPAGQTFTPSGCTTLGPQPSEPGLSTGQKAAVGTVLALGALFVVLPLGLMGAGIYALVKYGRSRKAG